MTNVERKKLAKAFRSCKKYLWDGKTVKKNVLQTSFICWALDTAADENKIHVCTAWSAKDIITERLDGHISVYSWLLNNANVAETLLTKQAIQEYRHRWVDSLIEEFSK